MIHWPIGLFSHPKKQPLHSLWIELEALVDKGLTRSIGVSNFNMQLMMDLLCYSRIKPVCNQIEINPHCQQASMLKFLGDQNILGVAYAPLGSPLNLKEEGKARADVRDMFEEPVLMKVAFKHQVTI